jgi:type II secretory pathway component GspD/PulD (secretin)
MKSKEGFIFKKFETDNQSPFERLFDIFKELITHTSGDFEEAINWLKELDKEYSLTNEDYTIEDFIEELKEKGYIKEEIDSNGDGNISLTAKTEQAIRQQALNQIFGRIKKMELATIKATNRVKETNTLVTSELFSLEIL